MINLEKFFNDLTDCGTLNQENKDLLEKLLSITNPKKFSDKIITEAQLEQLEQALIRLKTLEPEVKKFIITTLGLKPSIMSNPSFI